MDIVIEFILHFVLAFPGALMRWLFSDKSKSIKEVWKDNIYGNSIIGIITIAIVISLIYLAINFI